MIEVHKVQLNRHFNSDDVELIKSAKYGDLITVTAVLPWQDIGAISTSIGEKGGTSLFVDEDGSELLVRIVDFKNLDEGTPSNAMRVQFNLER